jgi:signal transduction histidine kinase
LSDPVLYEIGLEAAVESWLGKNVPKTTGINWELITDGPQLALGNRIKVTLFKGVKEAVTNVLKNAKAKRLIVFIKREKQQVAITVDDDGIGFDTAILAKSKLDKGSFGLFYLKERLNYLGGELEIKSEQEKGTCVKMTMPLKTSPAENSCL